MGLPALLYNGAAYIPPYASSLTLTAADDLLATVLKEPDAATGFLYSKKLGAYFDPATRLFGDPASARWFRAEPGGGGGYACEAGPQGDGAHVFRFKGVDPGRVHVQ